MVGMDRVIFPQQYDSFPRGCYTCPLRGEKERVVKCFNGVIISTTAIIAVILNI